MADELYLVTGAGGFTGSNLVRHLRAQGIAVRAMVHLSNANQALIESGAEIVRADIKEPAQLRAAFSGVTGVYHIAALFRKAGLPDSEYYQVNLEGTRNVFEAAIAEGVRRVVHCSTVGVLSHIANPPADEETPTNPADIYQASKLEGERLALEYYRNNKIKGVVIRPAMIYGPGDMRTLKLFRMIAKGTFFYVGPGNQSVHFIDVRDLARAFQLAMENDKRNGEIYIIAGQQSLPLKVLADYVAEQLGVRKPWLHLPIVPMQLLGDLCEAVCRTIRVNPPIYRRRVDFFTKNREFSCAKAKAQLGFKPHQQWQAEVADILSWYRENDLIP